MARRRTIPPMFRVYRIGKPYLLLGTVEAEDKEQGLRFAIKGKWLNYYAKKEDQPTSEEGLWIVQ